MNEEALDARLERNKSTVKACYDLMFNQGRPREAIERHVGAEYIQHNPHVAEGKKAFIAYSPACISQSCGG